MSTCSDPGVLRAYLDEELAATEAERIAGHIATCAACQEETTALTALDASVHDALCSNMPTMDAAPTADVAFARLQARLTATSSSDTVASKKRFATVRHPAFAGLAVAAALLLVILVPNARAAASALLSVFRAQSVVYVSVSPSRLEQLQHLRLDENTLFLSKPSAVGAPPTQQRVDSLAQAQSQLDFTPQSPTAFPSSPTATSYTVVGESAYRMQVNVKTLREVLATLGVTDVQIPDALGAHPIAISMPSALETQYQGSAYTITLIEGISPTVTLPNGVDLSQLGKAALEVYGLTPQQADTLSKQIDWRSTLVFPFPVGTNTIEQVTIHGTHGVMLDATDGGQAHYLLYWQQGSRFYVLDGEGDALGDNTMLAVADSVR